MDREEPATGDGDVVGGEAGADPAARAVWAALESELAVIDVEAIAAEESIAARRLSAIAAGRRKGGIAGAAMAGAMWSIQEIYIGPVKDDTPVAQVEAPGDPGDIDRDGIEVTVGDVDVWAPPPLRDGDQPDDDRR